MNEYMTQILDNVVVRKHNGQCEYGSDYWATDKDLPCWVGEMITNQIAETDADEGRVEQGGSIWVWWKVS